MPFAIRKIFRILAALLTFRLAEMRHEIRSMKRRRKIMALAKEGQKFPRDYSLSEDEILGYDERGLFK